MKTIKVEYINHNYKSKPIERLAINAATEASRTGKGLIDLIKLSAELKYYSKGLRNKLIYSNENGEHQIKAENLDKNLRATLLDYLPEWAKK